METYDRLAAYQAVMERIRETVKLPPNRAPASWLAEQLGTPRQLVYVWAERGIPEAHAEAIAKLLGMDPQEVCPQIPLYLPTDVFHAVVQSKKRKSFGARLVELIRLGLKREFSTSELPLNSNENLPKVARKQASSAPAEKPMKAVGGFIPISAEEMKTQREEAIKAGADLSVRGRSK